SLCGEEGIIGLFEPVVRVGVTAEMRVTQIELRRPRQRRELICRLNIPCGGIDPTIDRIISLQDELTVKPDIGVEFEHRTCEIAGIDVQAVAIGKRGETGGGFPGRKAESPRWALSG